MKFHILIYIYIYFKFEIIMYLIKKYNFKFNKIF